MDIIKIFEKIRKYNSENNAVKDPDPIKIKTFTEPILGIFSIDDFINDKELE